MTWPICFGLSVTPSSPFLDNAPTLILVFLSIALAGGRPERCLMARSLDPGGKSPNGGGPTWGAHVSRQRAQPTESYAHRVEPRRVKMAELLRLMGPCSLRGAACPVGFRGSSPTCFVSWV